jgi:hypothetical protein
MQPSLSHCVIFVVANLGRLVVAAVNREKRAKTVAV